MNKNKLYLGALTIVLVLLFSSAIFPVMTVKADSGYVEVPDGLEVGGQMDTSKVYWKYDATNLYLKVEYDGDQTSYTDRSGYFYIDSDMNAATGWSSHGIGADYYVYYDWYADGVPGSWLYARNSTMGLWDYVKYWIASSDGNWVEVTVPLVDIGSPVSGVLFYLESNNYFYDRIESIVTYTKGTPAAITVDGEISDWTTAGITPLLTDPSGECDKPEYDTTSIYLANDGDKFYVRRDTQAPANTTLLPSSSDSAVRTDFYMYFDTDKNAGTGEPIGGIGAESRARYEFDKFTGSVSTDVDAYELPAWTSVPDTDEGAVSATREWSTQLSSLGLNAVSSFNIYIDYANVYLYDVVPDSGAIAALLPSTPQSFSLMGNSVLEAGEGEAYFVYADPYRMERAVAAYDVTAGGIVYGLCMEHQKQNFDSYAGWVSQEESDKGRLIIENKAVLMFGSHWPHWCVDYLQSQGLTPVDFVEDWGAEQFKMVDHETSEVLATVNYNTHDFEHDDYFVLMAFTDENSNLCFIFYGFDWKGTWAAGIQLKTMIENIETYNETYYVYHWTDAGEMDGIPQTGEFALVS